jgi:hypothetical protein
LLPSPPNNITDIPIYHLLAGLELAALNISGIMDPFESESESEGLGFRDSDTSRDQDWYFTMHSDPNTFITSLKGIFKHG